MLVGMPVEDGRRLAESLVEWCTRPEYVYRHAWRRHDLVMWDNRCTMHNAINDYHGYRRRMRRLTVGPGLPR